VAVFVLLCGIALAGHGNHPVKDWADLREKNLGMGFSLERVDTTLASCRKRGLSVQQAEELLCPVYAADAEGLPTSCVFLKVEEGLAKGADWKEVRAAAERRRDCMATARRLVATRRGRGGRNNLVEQTCMALESGLPEDVLKEVFGQAGGRRFGRLTHVIEAGETLQLAGLPIENNKHFMLDCIDRDLDRSEIRRVVEVVIAGMTENKSFEDIHSSLWVVAE
jgi:hypothetical protein